MSLNPEQALALQRATGHALVRALDARAIAPLEIAAAARLSAPVRLGETLTQEEARQAWRLLSRNEARLVAAGITLPRPAAAPTAAARSVEPTSTGRPVLKLRSDNRIGVENYPTALRKALETEARARLDSQTSLRASTTGYRQWSTPATPAYAAALLAVLGPADPLVSARVRELASEYETNETLRAVLDDSAALPDFDAGPLIQGGSLWDHQRRAVEFATRSTASLLAVPMGGGKSMAAVTIINRLAPLGGGTKRVVIVAPNKVRAVWPREVAKWSRASWHLVDGKRPSRRRGARPQDLSVVERLEQAEKCLFDCACGAAVHAAVFNYEMLTHPGVAYRNVRNPGWVPPVVLDAVIYDEIHRLKSPTGSMSITAEHWVSYFARRIGLTGTPMPQYPWDIFGVLRALDPGIFGGMWTPFKARYIKESERQDTGKPFPVAIKSEYAQEFRSKVHALMYRPVIDLKLPGAHHLMRPVALEPKAAALYDELLADSVAQLLASQRVETNRPSQDEDPILSPRNVLARTVRLRQLTGGTLPDDGESVETATTGAMRVVRDQYRVSHAKAEDLAQFLDEVGCVPRAGGAEPVVVYCAFRSDLDAVREVAEGAGLRYGEISGRRSDGLNDRSEMAENIDVCGVQIASGGTGVDLTRSCYGYWYSVGYSAGDHDQALKRQDRPGQTRRVVFAHAVAVGTVDVQVYQSLASRRSLVGTFLNAQGLGALSPEDGADPEMSLDEVATMFNEARAREGVRTRGGERVGLPIDDFANDVFGDPSTRASAATPSAALLAEYGLEGL